MSKSSVFIGKSTPIDVTSDITTNTRFQPFHLCRNLAKILVEKRNGELWFVAAFVNFNNKQQTKFNVDAF